jgi:hypothetical protein
MRIRFSFGSEARGLVGHVVTSNGRVNFSSLNCFWHESSLPKRRDLAALAGSCQQTDPTAWAPCNCGKDFTLAFRLLSGLQYKR